MNRHLAVFKADIELPLIVAIVIAIVIVIVGAVSLVQLAIEQYPNLTPPIVQVRGTYTGANALNVEEAMATPLEQQINGVGRVMAILLFVQGQFKTETGALSRTFGMGREGASHLFGGQHTTVEAKAVSIGLGGKAMVENLS